MKSELISISKLFKDPCRYLVPVYQRGYVWTQKETRQQKEEQWDLLWEDLEKLAIKRLNKQKDQKLWPHFTGMMVVEESRSKKGRGKKIDTYNIVDGQQRLLTFQLILAAIYRYAKEYEFEAIQKKIEPFIFNPDTTDTDKNRFKVWPNARRNGTDQKLFSDILQLSYNEFRDKYWSDKGWHEFLRGIDRGILFTRIFNRNRIFVRPLPPLYGCFGFFTHKIINFIEINEKHSPKKSLEILLNTVLTDFRIVKFSLGKKADPQIIFETVNGRGVPLLQSDLTKNDIFRRIINRKDENREQAETLFNQYWKFFDNRFWEEQKNERRHEKITLDDFFICFLESKTGEPVSPPNLFSEYKNYIQTNPYKDVKDELADLVKYGKIYKIFFHTPDDDDPDLERLKLKEADNIEREISALGDYTTLYPLFLSLWGDENASLEEKQKCFDLIFSYIIRRSICKMSEKNYNNYFLDLVKRIIDKHDSVWSKQNLAKQMHHFQSDSRIFPDNKKFLHRFIGGINPNKINYILKKIETKKAGRKPEFGENTIQIEHILPRSWEEHWRQLPNGEQPSEEQLEFARDKYIPEGDKKEIHKEITERDQWLLTIGNLTLLTTEQNKEADNKSFADKKAIYEKDQLGLDITEMVTEQTDWNEKKIVERASELFKIAKKVWEDLPASVRSADE